MEDKPQIVSLRYYGISPWEIEVIYNIFNKKFEVIQDVIERDEYLQSRIKESSDGLRGMCKCINYYYTTTV